MKSGPPPKPTAVKKLEGNPGRRPLNRREPRPCSRLPAAPGALNPRAAALWKSLGSKLVGLGVLTDVDGPVFADYCQTVCQWEELQEQVNKEGVMVESHGQTVPNPKLSLANKLAERRRKLEGEFGLTPASRTRVSVPEPAADDGLSKLIAEIGDAPPPLKLAK